jgi:alpha-glucosidase
MPETAPYPWWRHAAVYQIYIRSFADGNDDGTGDIEGIRSRLPYLERLGVDALWINPWYVTPLKDGGYDVANYIEIDGRFGTLDEASRLIAEVNERGMRVLVDLVPNHTSSEHAWFASALAANPESPERSRYHFLPGKGKGGAEPPNAWKSVFGGSAWTRVPDGDWYLHLFDPSQPDLNWSNPAVRKDFKDVLRFWLGRGASGFRVDVAMGLFKDPDYSDEVDDHPFWDQPGVHDVIREWRSVLDEYPESVMVAEAWVDDWERLAHYLRPDEYHQVFDFEFLQAPWGAASIRSAIDDSLQGSASVGSVPTWVLSNHDVVRHATRYGLPDGVVAKEWLLGGDRSVLDADLGLRRARAATLLAMALPGSVYLYQGEELGLPEVHDLATEALDDPTWHRSGNSEKGRDGCRVPLPWTTDGPSHGFGTSEPWLPQPDGWGKLAVDQQIGQSDSTLEMYRSALAIRRELLVGDEDIEWLDYGPETIAFRRGGGLVCVVNLGTNMVSLEGGTVLLSSGPLTDRQLSPDTAAWIR